jgi:hypothetical protein
VILKERKGVAKFWNVLSNEIKENNGWKKLESFLVYSKH